MNHLNMLYSKLLGFGFTFLREAVDLQNYDWANAEIELLHNVPSLLDESNVERHRYFWFTERNSYIEWASALGRDKQQRRMKVYYEPVWKEMEPVLLEWFERQTMDESPSAS